MGKEIKEKININSVDVLFIGEDLSIFHSLKNLSSKLETFLIEKTNFSKNIITNNNFLIVDDSINNFNEKCLKGIKPNIKKIRQGVENSLMLVTVLAPEIGYTKAAEIAKLAHKKNISLVEANKILKYIENKKIKSLLSPSKMISSS